MFKDKDDAATWALELMKKYGIPNDVINNEGIIPIDMFNNKTQKHIEVLEEDDGYHD